MSDQVVMNMLIKRASEAGIERAAPHDLRRTFISDLLDSGADLLTVQKLAGHANPATTAGQTHQNLAQYRCFFVDCALSCQLIDRCGNIK